MSRRSVENEVIAPFVCLVRRPLEQTEASARSKERERNPESRTES